MSFYFVPVNQCKTPCESRSVVYSRWRERKTLKLNITVTSSLFFPFSLCQSAKPRYPLFPTPRGLRQDELCWATALQSMENHKTWPAACLERSFAGGTAPGGGDPWAHRGETGGAQERRQEHSKATTEAGGESQAKVETEWRPLWGLGNWDFPPFYLCLDLSQIPRVVYLTEMRSLREVTPWIISKHGIKMQKH